MHLARHVRIAVLAFAAFATLGRSAPADDSNPRVFTCPPIKQDIVVDGDLAEWDTSAPI